MGMHGCVIFEGYEIIIQVDFSIQIMKAMNNYGRGMYSMHRAENKGLLVFLCVCSTYSGGSIRVKGGPIMRIVEKLLYGIGGLLALVLLFILLCKGTAFVFLHFSGIPGIIPCLIPLRS